MDGTYKWEWCPAIAIIRSHFLYEVKFISMPVGFQCPAREDAQSSLREMPLGLGTRQKFISLLINWQCLLSSSALKSGCFPFDWFHVNVLRERPKTQGQRWSILWCPLYHGLASPISWKEIKQSPKMEGHHYKQGLTPSPEYGNVCWTDRGKERTLKACSLGLSPSESCLNAVARTTEPAV